MEYKVQPSLLTDTRSPLQVQHDDAARIARASLRSPAMLGTTSFKTQPTTAETRVMPSGSQRKWR
jgi:hypothetical protein